jgi:hypothetical protein
MKTSKVKFSKFSKRLFIANLLATAVFMFVSMVVFISFNHSIDDILIGLLFEFTFLILSSIYIYLNEYFSKLLASQSKSKKHAQVLLFCFIGISKSMIILLPAILISILYACHVSVVSTDDLIISLCQAAVFCLLITIISLIKKK